MTDYTELKRLAEDCKEREIDFDDVSPHQGSTSCDKLVRHYLAAASPDVVLSMIDHVQETDAANLEWMQRSVEQSKEIDRLRTQNQALLDAKQEMSMARENAILRVALREIQEASNWAYGSIADKLGETK